MFNSLCYSKVSKKKGGLGMNKIQDKIVHADFKKIARRFIAAAIVFAVAGAAAGGLILKPQIQDAYALHQNKDKIVKQVEQAQGSNEKSDKYKQDADHEKEHEVDWEDVYKDQITPPSTGAFVGLGILGAIGLAFGIVYWLLIAAWLYQAATKARMKRVIWCIAGLICNLAAVVVFLIVRSIVRITCGNCGTVQKRQEFCSHCGAWLLFDKEICHVAYFCIWLCYYKALQDGPASVVVPVDKLSILVTILFSWLVFRETLSKKAAVGLADIVAGTLLLLF